MTDKQIIIDSVDVSGCKYYVENNGIEAQGCYELTDLCECNNENEFCDNNSNCYYKQLKRKEKSEEKLVKQIQTICDFINNRPETFKGVNGSVDKIITDYTERKEQECERLKDIIETKLEDANICDSALNYINDEYIYVKRKLDQLKAENEELKEQFKLAEPLYQACNIKDKKINKLKQTITEIKEIATCPRKIETTFNINNWIEIRNNILQKISEVEDDNR